MRTDAGRLSNSFMATLKIIWMINALINQENILFQFFLSEIMKVTVTEITFLMFINGPMLCFS